MYIMYSPYERIIIVIQQYNFAEANMAENAKDKDAKEKTVNLEKMVKKNFVNPDNIKPVYANDMTVARSERELFFSFYQTEPPLVLSQEDVDKLDRVDCVLVSKIIVTHEFAELVLKAIKTNIDSSTKKEKKE